MGEIWGSDKSKSVGDSVSSKSAKSKVEFYGETENDVNNENVSEENKNAEESTYNDVDDDSDGEVKAKGSMLADELEDDVDILDFNDN